MQHDGTEQGETDENINDAGRSIIKQTEHIKTKRTNTNNLKRNNMEQHNTHRINKQKHVATEQQEIWHRQL